MKKPPKRDWIELIEERTDQLEKRIKQLEEYIKTMNIISVNDMTACMHVAILSTMPKVEIGHLDNAIKLIKEKEKELMKVKGRIYLIPSESIIEGIIEISKNSNIPFHIVIPHLLEKLGKDIAKRIVKEEIILKHFGKEGLDIWRTLLTK